AVAPNNPLGTTYSAAERRAVEERCRDAGVALVVDEVFADYPLDGPPAPRWLPGGGGFVLSGLSKVAALPQVKLSWILVTGPPAFADPVLARLEIIADTFLSVSTSVQLALPELLRAG